MIKRHQRPIKRYPRDLELRIPRPIERISRSIKRFPRDFGPRIPRPVRRFPRKEYIIRRSSDFPPLYNLERKPKDEYPELFEELQKLKDKFKKLGRKISVHCVRSRDRHFSSLETCICRCKKKCDSISFRNLVGPNEGPAQYIDDFIRFQRLTNLIYGTVRMKDIKLVQDK